MLHVLTCVTCPIPRKPKGSRTLKGGDKEGGGGGKKNGSACVWEVQALVLNKRGNKTKGVDHRNSGDRCVVRVNASLNEA